MLFPSSYPAEDFGSAKIQPTECSMRSATVLPERTNWKACNMHGCLFANSDTCVLLVTYVMAWAFFWANGVQHLYFNAFALNRGFVEGHCVFNCLKYSVLTYINIDII